MLERDFNRLGMSVKEFNNLPREDQFNHFKGDFYNPFDLPPDAPMLNPFTFKTFGKWRDGSHLLVHIFSGHIYNRILVRNNVVIKVEELNDEYRWVEIKKPWRV